jgi:ElaB/YqjD/DUF883 family membrane-anchored ribosome-binding protein
MTRQAMSTPEPINAVAGQAHKAIDRAADSAQPALDRATAAAHRTVDRAADAAKPAAEWVTESGKQVAARSGAMVDACGNYVRARPLATVAAALALGYLAGKWRR